MGSSIMRHLCLILLCGHGFVSCKQFAWLNTPGPVRACANGHATFPWHYDVNSTSPITFFQWQFMKRRETVLQKSILNGEEDIVYYEYGEDRVELTDTGSANAGIVLKKLVLGDAGEYLVRLSGGVTDRASLQVYTDEELAPALEIGNSPIPFGSVYNMSDCDRCVLVITTAQALTAHITMTTSGLSDVIECQKKTTCSKIINFSALAAGMTRVSFKVDYGFCEIQETYVDLYWDGVDPNPDPGIQSQQNNNDNDGESGGLTSKWEFILGLALGVLVIVVIVLVAVVITLVKYLQRKQKKDVVSGKDSLSSNQKRMLVAVAKWKSVSKRTSNQSYGRSKSCDATISTKLADPEEGDVGLLRRDDPEGNDVRLPMVDPEPVCEIHFESPDADVDAPDVSEVRSPPAGSSDVVELVAPADERDVPVDMGEEVTEDVSDQDNSDEEADNYDRLRSIDSTASGLKDFVIVPKC